MSTSGGTYEGFFSKSEDPLVQKVFEMAKKEEYGFCIFILSIFASKMISGVL